MSFGFGPVYGTKAKKLRNTSGVEDLKLTEVRRHPITAFGNLRTKPGKNGDGANYLDINHAGAQLLIHLIKSFKKKIRSK